MIKIKNKTNEELLSELRQNIKQAPYKLFSKELDEGIKLLKECLDRDLLEEDEVWESIYRIESFKKPYFIWV